MLAGDHASARQNLEKALHENPNAPQIQEFFAEALRRSGDLQAAVRVVQRLTQQHPDRIQAWLLMGDLCLRLQRFPDVHGVVRQLALLAPKLPHSARFAALLALEEQRFEDADRLLRAWLAVDPTNDEARGILADLLSRARRFDDAETLFQTARRRQPDDLNLTTRYAHHLGRKGDYVGCRDLFTQVARADPSQGVHHANQGIAEIWSGDLDAATTSLTRATQMEPTNASHFWNLAHALLQSGDLEEGFKVYEHRVTFAGAPDWWADRWRGEHLPAGTPLVLDSDQGLGDGIQFVRFAADAAARGAKVTVRAHPRLLPLFARVQGVDAVLSSEETPPVGARRGKLLSLPHVVGLRSEEDLGSRVPYLTVEADRIETWRQRLHPEGLRVGIIWQGNPRYARDQLRSPPLKHYLSLTEIPGVHLYSLQKFHGTEQLEQVDPTRHPITPLGPELDLDVAFLDTAATMCALDLVLTSDTSTAHLAGGLGVPTWVVIPYAPDWRWPRDADTTPWYPSMRLFRQQTPCDWPGVFARVETALRQLAAQKHAPSP
jgi:Flp pilus assembly protein TadD